LSNSITRYENLNPLKRFFSTLALVLAAFLFVLDYTVANVALPFIAGGLASAVNEGTYVITSFAIGNAIFVPLTGYFSTKFGMIRVIIYSVLFFTLFSFLSAISANLFTLVLFRFLAGASAGALIPLSQGLLVLIQPKSRINLFMALYALIILVAPALGPIFGGWISEEFDWRWIFYINIPVGVFCVIALKLTLGSINEKKDGEKLDVMGFLFLFMGMASLQIFLDKGQEWDWFGSNKILITFVLAILGIYFLVVSSVSSEEPILDLKLLKIPNFLTASIVIFFSYSIYFGSVVIIPLWLQTQMGYNALNAGISVAPIGIGSILVLFLALKIVSKFGPLILMIIGFFLMGLASEYVRYFPADIDRNHIMLSRFIMGVGIGFWIIPMMNMAALSLPENKLAKGLGLFHFIRGISGAIGASIYPTLYERRMIRAHENIVSKLQLNKLHEVPESLVQGKDYLLDMIIQKQASVVAINEVFHFMGIIFFILAICMLFVLKADKQKKLSLSRLDLPIE
jgi:DHA2 family multidrug resistance protein